MKTMAMMQTMSRPPMKPPRMPVYPLRTARERTTPLKPTVQAQPRRLCERDESSAQSAVWASRAQVGASPPTATSSVSPVQAMAAYSGPVDAVEL